MRGAHRRTDHGAERGGLHQPCGHRGENRPERGEVGLRLENGTCKPVGDERRHPRIAQARRGTVGHRRGVQHAVRGVERERRHRGQNHTRNDEESGYHRVVLTALSAGWKDCT